MTKQEINEIKKLFTAKNCSITRICGCYVDGEKNKKTELNQAFLALPEEEMFKYFEILRKSLSGSIGKNLLNLDFPTDSEIDGGTQEFLLRLRDSRLKDDALLEQFYNRIIESYEYVEKHGSAQYAVLFQGCGGIKRGLRRPDAWLSASAVCRRPERDLPGTGGRDTGQHLRYRNGKEHS